MPKKLIVIIIEPAKKSDAHVIVKLSLLLNADDETKTSRGIKNQIEFAIKNKLLWVAKSKKGIVGFAAVELFGGSQPNFPNSIFLSELYVDKDFRKHGIASELIRNILKQKFSKRFKYFSVTHDPARRSLTEFYEKFGFKKAGVTKVGNIKLICRCG